MQGASPDKAAAGGSLSLLVSGLFTTSIYSNYVWSVLNLALSKGLRFAGMLLCIRQTGAMTWGQVTSTLAVMTFLNFLVDQGLSEAPQIFKVQDRALDRSLLWKISLYRLGMAVLAVASLHALALVVPAFGPLLLWFSFVLILRGLNIDWFFHRRERYHLVMVINSIRAVVYFGLVTALVSEATSAKTLLAIEMAAEAGGLIFSYALLWSARRGGETARAGLSLRELLMFAAPILLTGLLHAVPAADLIFLKFLCGYEVVAQYDIGGKIGFLYFMLGATLIQIIIPKLARMHALGNPARMAEILASSSKLLLILSSALLIPSFYFSEEIVEWIFGKEYTLTVFVFQWIPVWVYVSCLTQLNSIVLLAMNRRREYLFGALLTSLASLAGNWALIGLFAGSGAVFARILAEAVFLVYAVAKVPAAIRAGFAREIGVQIANLAVLLALFLAYAQLGERTLFLALSLAFTGAVVFFQKTFSRRVLASFMDN